MFEIIYVMAIFQYIEANDPKRADIQWEASSFVCVIKIIILFIMG